MAGVALIHLLDLPSQIHTVPWIAVSYVGLIVASVIVADGMVTRPSQYRLAAVAVAVLPALAYVAIRTIGLPGDGADRGNWADPWAWRRYSWRSPWLPSRPGGQRQRASGTTQTHLIEDRVASRPTGAAWPGPRHAEAVTREVFAALWRSPEDFGADRRSLGSPVAAEAHGRAVYLLRADISAVQADTDGQPDGDPAPGGVIRMVTTTSSSSIL